MEDFDIEKHPDPPSDYVNWTLSHFKVDDETGNFKEDPGYNNNDSGESFKIEITPQHSPEFKIEVTASSDPLAELDPWESLQVNQSYQQHQHQHQHHQNQHPDPQHNNDQDQEEPLSKVDLGHICEIVGSGGGKNPDHEKQYICLYCGDQHNWINLSLHMRFGHSSNDKVILCKRFNCEYHTKIAHNKQDIDPLLLTTEDKEPGCNVPANNGAGAGAGVVDLGATAAAAAAAALNEIHKCVHCDFQTKKKAGLKEHVRLMHVKEEEQQQPQTLHSCLICGFQTKYKYGLKKHSKKHGELALHKCSFCDYQTIKPLLEEHIKFKHSESLEKAAPAQD